MYNFLLIYDYLPNLWLCTIVGVAFADARGARASKVLLTKI